MSFFDETLLEMYSSIDVISDMLGENRLLTHHQYKKCVKQSKCERSSAQRCFTICRNYITTGYIRHTLDKAKNDPEYDLLFSVSPLGKILGFVSIKILSKRRLKIHLICTSGIKGKLLLGAVFTQARARGFQKIFLDVAGGSENSSAISAYSTMGFIYDPAIPYDYGMEAKVPTTYEAIIDGVAKRSKNSKKCKKSKKSKNSKKSSKLKKTSKKRSRDQKTRVD